MEWVVNNKIHSFNGILTLCLHAVVIFLPLHGIRRIALSTNQSTRFLIAKISGFEVNQAFK